MRRSKSKTEIDIPAINPISVKNTFTRNLPTDEERIKFILQSVQNAVNNGTIDVGGSVSDLELETVESSSANIQNARFSVISALNDLITFDAAVRLQNDLSVGASDAVFDLTNTYNIQLVGSIYNNGVKTLLNTDETIIKNNVLGIGVNNVGTDNFVNGIYFPKRDNYSSQGSVILDRAGIISLAYGQFLNNTTYAPITLQNNRFEGGRTSIRCVYLDQELSFTGRTSSTVFTNGQQNYVNSLNNIDNAESIYYTNFESHNITLHGGKIVGGINKDIEFHLTSGSNIETKFLSMVNSTQSIIIDVNLGFSKTTNVETLFPTRFTSSNILNFSISDTNTIISRDIRVLAGIPIQITGDEFDIRDSNSSSMIKFTNLNNSNPLLRQVSIDFYQGSFLVEDIFGDVQLEMDQFTKIKGPFYNAGSPSSYSETTLNSEIQRTSVNDINNPTFELINKENTITTLNCSSSRIYLQNKSLAANGNVNFQFSCACLSSQTDLIFSGYAIISSTDTNSNSHIHLRLDGSYHNSNSSSIITRTVIKREVVDLDDINFTESVSIGSTTTTPTLDLLLTNSTNNNFKVALKLEIFSI